MNAVILACSSLIGHVNAAQAKMETNYPLITVDRKYHVDPTEMNRQIFERLQKLPENVDTVLAAMGFCGGSWDKVPSEKRIVIPRADDCISLLLHADGMRHPNLKESGHFYLRDSDTAPLFFDRYEAKSLHKIRYTKRTEYFRFLVCVIYGC